MVRVVATGVFDIIHLGHVHFLEKAKDLGDELVVVVAKDSTARKMKHEPITPEGMRVELVQSLKPVDRAVLGYEDDMYKIIQEVRPDIIALGYDQQFDERELKDELSKRGIRADVVRLPHLDHDLDGTRKIIRKIINWHTVQQRLKDLEGGGKE
ncbi:MAG: FAD synthase [Thermoplasmata archaeon]|nr:FAD synthase [Thermoplasmata archaeon]